MTLTSYPNAIDTFVSKLNFNEDKHIITNETLSFVGYDATYERAAIAHDNCEDIVVKQDGVELTVDIDYTIVADENKPWSKYIQRTISGTYGVWTVDYKTEGDETEADDINKLQDAVKAIQELLGPNMSNVSTVTSGAGIGVTGTMPLLDDFNNTTIATGMYRYTADTLNRPVLAGCSYGQVVINRYDGSNIVQIITSHASNHGGKIWIRRYHYVEGWGPAHEVYTTYIFDKDNQTINSLIAPNGIMGANTGAVSVPIWTVSGQYNNWGIFYNQSSPDTIDFRSAGATTSQVDLESGAHIIKSAKIDDWEIKQDATSGSLKFIYNG